MRALVISKEGLLGNITFPHDDKLTYRTHVMMFSQQNRKLLGSFLRNATIQRGLVSDVLGCVIEVLSCTIFSQRQLVLALRHVVSSEFLHFC